MEYVNKTNYMFTQTQLNYNNDIKEVNINVIMTN